MKKRLVFFGTPSIAVEVLKGIDKNNFEIVGIVTQTDKKVGRKQEVTPPPVKQFGIENSICVFQPEKVSSIIKELTELKPDIILTCAYGKLLPKSVLDLVSGMAINVHASLLPKYRGSAPIQYAIMNGEKQTGISLMQMVQEMDAGDFYVQEKVEITENDNFESLYNKLAILGGKMVGQYLNDIYNGKIKPNVQDLSKVTLAPKILNNMEKINFNKSSQEVLNFIKALSPSPGAYAILNGERYKFYNARLLHENEFFAMTLNIKRSGEVISMDKEGFVVWTSRGMIKILEVQKQGKNRMSAGNYFSNQQREVTTGNVFNEDEAKFDF
ncbi:methionyl-tRNA formyltransferase [Spiroplasma alleghenense]|uniref:Methionyl-tRNA formyltransferase n=1 Tax=Spiroplasma alleghenense TaxID=216931 RepID=A0A345Z3A4_9MOLU|nr:methionyl-tRNA formyltransferase [Spiroplasma alleghenense]AXK51083.1 methionyl-tRNA formyltransferase [Spiroplasma alleghenense]